MADRMALPFFDDYLVLWLTKQAIWEQWKRNGQLVP